jgi:hypothetical protein
MSCFLCRRDKRWAVGKGPFEVCCRLVKPPTVTESRNFWRECGGALESKGVSNWLPGRFRRPIPTPDTDAGTSSSRYSVQRFMRRSKDQPLADRSLVRRAERRSMSSSTPPLSHMRMSSCPEGFVPLSVYLYNVGVLDLAADSRHLQRPLSEA